DKKEVFAQDPNTGAFMKGMCPLCMCLDCVQQFDDPIRQKTRPLRRGQRIHPQYNRTVDEFKPGDKEPTKRRLTINAPGPLNMKQAVKEMGNLLGLQPPEPPKQHRLPQAVACRCAKNATSRCISCDVPLCVKCLKAHEC